MIKYLLSAFFLIFLLQAYADIKLSPISNAKRIHPYSQKEKNISSEIQARSLRNLQRWHEELQQRQLQQEQPIQFIRYSRASALSFITNPLGVSDPNGRIYTYSEATPEKAKSFSKVDSSMGYGLSRSIANDNSLLQVRNHVVDDLSFKQPIYDGSYKKVNYGEGSEIPSYSREPESYLALAAASIGLKGGFQVADITTRSVIPQKSLRFSENVIAHSDNYYGVFSSSSSHQLIGQNGKLNIYQDATTAINDNGKISFRTIRKS